MTKDETKEAKYIKNKMVSVKTDRITTKNIKKEDSDVFRKEREDREDVKRS